MIKYFNSLSQEEVEKFDEFVSSPYFNKNEKNIKLFKYLKSLYPFLEPPDIKNEALFKNIYDEPYNAVKASRMISDFNRVFEKFIYQLEHENNIIYNNLLCLTALSKRGLRKKFEENSKKIIENFDEQFLKDDDYYYTYQNIQYENYSFYRDELSSAFPPEQLQKRSDNLDYFYFFSKLHTFRDMLLYQDNAGKKLNFTHRMRDEILTFIRDNAAELKEHHPNLYIIYLSLMMESNLEDNSFAVEYIEYLAYNHDRIPKGKLKYYYNYLLSFYITKVNNGELSFRKNLLELIKIIDKYNLFLFNEFIPETDFNRAVITALTVGEFEWAEYFINTYGKRLQPDIKENIVNLSLAKLYFYKKDYAKASKWLQKVTEKASSTFINSRILEAKIAYEEKNFISIDYLIEGMRRYLERNKKVREIDVINNKKFLYFLRELVKLHSNKENTLIIKKQLDNEEGFVPDKYWLYAKIGELNTTS